MWTKICGTTNLDDALLAAELGADAIGFVFAASRRQVTAEQVAAIVPSLPSSVEKVGVFDTPDAAWIVDVATRARLTAVQLHFALDLPLLGELQAAFEGRVRLIAVVGVPVEAEAGAEERLSAEISAAFGRPELFAVLLDAARGGHSGGLGQPFHWQTMSAILQAAFSRGEDSQADDRPHLLLAGGLRPENVAAAVRVIRPWGVDVVSGVEAAPGTKDPERLSHFLQIARTI